MAIRRFEQRLGTDALLSKKTKRPWKMLHVDSAEKPSWLKNLKFLGDQITLPVSQKPAYGHFRASFFATGLSFPYDIGKGRVFQQNPMNVKTRPSAVIRQTRAAGLRYLCNLQFISFLRLLRLNQAASCEISHELRYTKVPGLAVLSMPHTVG
jgi:hypothetical protein